MLGDRHTEPDEPARPERRREVRGEPSEAGVLCPQEAVQVRRAGRKGRGERDEPETGDAAEQTDPEDLPAGLNLAWLVLLLSAAPVAALS